MFPQSGGGSVFPKPPVIQCTCVPDSQLILSYYTVRTSETLTSTGTSPTPRSGEMGHSNALTVEAAHFIAGCSTSTAIGIMMLYTSLTQALFHYSHELEVQFSFGEL